MTIFALSTGSVKSGIAIIRISGPNTKKVLGKITKINYQTQGKQPCVIYIIMKIMN